MKATVEPWTVKSRCLADWEKMKGDDKRRFCNQWQKFVYNLSAMNGEEREALARPENIAECVYYHRDSEGRVLDLSFLAKLRRRFPSLRWVRWSAIVALVPAALTGCMMGMRCPRNILPPEGNPAQTPASTATPLSKQ